MVFVYFMTVLVVLFSAKRSYSALENYEKANILFITASIRYDEANEDFINNVADFLDWKESSSNFSAKYLSPFQKKMLELKEKKNHAGRQ